MLWWANVFVCEDCGEIHPDTDAYTDERDPDAWLCVRCWERRLSEQEVREDG